MLDGLTKDVTIVSYSVIVASSVMICSGSSTGDGAGAEVVAGTGGEAVVMSATTERVGAEIEDGLDGDAGDGVGMMIEALNECAVSIA